MVPDYHRLDLVNRPAQAGYCPAEDRGKLFRPEKMDRREGEFPLPMEPSAMAAERATKESHQPTPDRNRMENVKIQPEMKHHQHHRLDHATRPIQAEHCPAVGLVLLFHPEKTALR